MFFSDPHTHQVRSLPRAWTDLALPDPFVVVATGKAVLRFSDLQQVLENTESTSRQYALRERARALGWADERIVVIDQDLGHSGASTVDRLGFQRLVAEVGLGQVGLVLGLEVSRLARNSSDWHHLLEILSLTAFNGHQKRHNLAVKHDYSSSNKLACYTA